MQVTSTVRTFLCTVRCRFYSIRQERYRLSRTRRILRSPFMLRVESWSSHICLTASFVAAAQFCRGPAIASQIQSLALERRVNLENEFLFEIPLAGSSRSQGTGTAELLAGAMERVPAHGGEVLALTSAGWFARPSLIVATSDRAGDDWQERTRMRVAR